MSEQEHQFSFTQSLMLNTQSRVKPAAQDNQSIIQITISPEKNTITNLVQNFKNSRFAKEKQTVRFNIDNQSILNTSLGEREEEEKEGKCFNCEKWKRWSVCHEKEMQQLQQNLIEKEKKMTEILQNQREEIQQQKDAVKELEQKIKTDLSHIQQLQAKLQKYAEKEEQMNQRNDELLRQNEILMKQIALVPELEQKIDVLLKQQVQIPKLQEQIMFLKKQFEYKSNQQQQLFQTPIKHFRNVQVQNNEPDIQTPKLTYPSTLQKQPIFVQPKDSQRQYQEPKTLQMKYKFTQINNSFSNRATNNLKRNNQNNLIKTSILTTKTQGWQQTQTQKNQKRQQTQVSQTKRSQIQKCLFDNSILEDYNATLIQRLNEAKYKRSIF